MSEKKKTLVECAQEILDVYDEDIHQIIPIRAFTGLDFYFKRGDVVDERGLLNLGDDSDIGIIFIGITDKEIKLNHVWFNLQITNQNDFFIVDPMQARRKKPRLQLGRRIANAKKTERVKYLDLNPLNLTKKNLIKSNFSESFLTKVNDRNSSSNFLGVSYIKKAKSTQRNWKVEFTTNKKKTYVGAFFSEEAAATAYNIAKIVLAEGLPMRLNEINILDENMLALEVKTFIEKGSNMNEAIKKLDLDEEINNS